MNCREPRASKGKDMDAASAVDEAITSIIGTVTLTPQEPLRLSVPSMMLYLTAPKHM
ncbi:MAG: hypothetical protein ACLVH0_04255 [Coprococcus eutactus]